MSSNVGEFQMSLASRIVVVGVFAALPAIITACKSDPVNAAPPSGGDADAGVTVPADGEAPLPASTIWLTTDCGACVIGGCASERALCDTEPSCSVHAQCAERCPAGADGRIDAACLAACPLTEGTAASRARAAYDSCLVTRGPRTCAACVAATPVPVAPIIDQTCSASAETNTCFACEDEKCCETYAGCVADPECKTVLQPCLVECGDDAACEAKCYADHPKGVSAWAKRRTCLDTNCAIECGATSIDPCFECVVMKECREPHARCSADEGCFLIEKCISATCPDVTDTCLATCKANVSPASAALFDDFVSCGLLVCGDKCG